MNSAARPSISPHALSTFSATGSREASQGKPSAPGQDGDLATFVLVHPAWLGGWCWRRVAWRLRERGHEVHTPTLTGLGERIHLANPAIGLATHVDDIVNVLDYEDLRRVILVGNSSGGMVITGVADRVPERLAAVVYLDAFVPDDGQSLVDLLPGDRRQEMRDFVDTEGDGWLLPRFAPLPWDEIVRNQWGVTTDVDVSWMMARLAPTPLRPFTEPVTRSNPAAAQVPHVYIRCNAMAHAGFDRHARMARDTDGWTCLELATPHLPYITHPAELAALLLDLAASQTPHEAAIGSAIRPA